MATLAAIGNGNSSSASTWGLVDATSYLDTRAATTSATTSIVASAASTLTAINVAGIALQIAGRSTSPSGTLTVQLFNATSSSVVNSVTVNVSDLPNTNGLSASYMGWVYFKFASPSTLTNGNSYTVRVSASTNSQVVLYTSVANNGNWSKALVTTTTQAPANTDNLIISGEYTGQGTSSGYTVTCNWATGSQPSIVNFYLGPLGTFNYSTTAGRYSSTVTTLLQTGVNSTLQIGTQASPYPSNCTAVFNFTSAAGISLFIHGAFTTYGNNYTTRALLNSDISVGATQSTLDRSTNWLSGQTMVIPSTTTTTTQVDAVTITANSVSNVVNHTATSFAHGGNSGTLIQADIYILDRNVQFVNTSTTNRVNFVFSSLSNVSSYYTSFVNFGSSTAAGLTFSNTLGTIDFQFNVVRNTATLGVLSLSNTLSSGFTLSNNLFYNLGSANNVISSSINNSNSFINCLGTPVQFGTILGPNNVFASCSTISSQSPISTNATGTTFYASTTGPNFTISASTYVSNVIDSLRVWRCSTALSFSLPTSTAPLFVDRGDVMLFKNAYIFGCGTYFSLTYPFYLRTSFVDSRFWSGTGPFLNISAALPQGSDSLQFTNCGFGINHTGGTAQFSSYIVGGGGSQMVLFDKCTFNGTEYGQASTSTQAITNSTQGIVSINHNNVNGDFRMYQRGGYLQTDSTYFTSGTKSIRMVPSLTTNKTFTPNVKVPVKSGQAATISVKVRKSASPDTVYNGSQPRLMWQYLPSSGNNTYSTTADTVVATATAASNGAWETLTYTTPTMSGNTVLDFYVDCNGTAGFVSVDDWSCNLYNDTRNLDYVSVFGTHVDTTYKKLSYAIGFAN